MAASGQLSVRLWTGYGAGLFLVPLDEPKVNQFFSYHWLLSFTILCLLLKKDDIFFR